MERALDLAPLDRRFISGKYGANFLLLLHRSPFDTEHYS